MNKVGKLFRDYSDPDANDMGNPLLWDVRPVIYFSRNYAVNDRFAFFTGEGLREANFDRNGIEGGFFSFPFGCHFRLRALYLLAARRACVAARAQELSLLVLNREVELRIPFDILCQREYSPPFTLPHFIDIQARAKFFFSLPVAKGLGAEYGGANIQASLYIVGSLYLRK